MFPSRMNYVYIKFTTTVESPLGEHFGVPGKYTWSKQEYDEFRLTVQRKYTVVPSLDLPDDVCRYIASFLHIQMDATFHIKYISAFAAPQWSLRDCTTNLFINLEGPLKIHNRGYMDEWTPAMTMESDILHLILTILPVIRNGSK
jgi:hypothetical protein